MGKIYNDIDTEQDAQKTAEDQTKNMIETLFSVSGEIIGYEGIKFRDSEISRIHNIMDKETELRSVLLVGDYGIGKRTVIDGYAYKLSQSGRGDIIEEVDFGEIIKKSQKGDFGQIVNDILFVAGNSESPNIVLVINDIGHLLNQNCYGNAGYSFVNSLISTVENDGVRVITTSTTEEFKDIENNFSKVLDYFTVIRLPELTKEQTSEIISDCMRDCQSTYNLGLPSNIVELICDNADKYIKDKVFPGKAINLLDEVCASLVNKYRKPDNTSVEITNEISHLKLDLQEAIEDNDLERCKDIQSGIESRLETLSSYVPKMERVEASEMDVLETIGHILGVKMSKLSKDQTEFLREMPNELKRNVIGQDEAIDVVVKNIRRNQLGLRKTRHSAGNFMFIGPTGVGKTYLAKQIAKYMYGSEDNFLRLDMSEFQAEIDVSKLLGSAPGYVGYKESGLLVKGLSKNPETVVLFDEIEKAHTKIFDVLLQLLDEGFVTGSDGKKVDASKSLIIFTSNIGVKEAMEMSNPMGFNNDENKKEERKEKIIRKALKNRFSPEFLNRLDNICYFNSLTEDALRPILHKELDEVNVGIKNITGKTVVLTPESENWILKKVENEDNGARPIIRILQQDIEEPVSDMIINEDPILENGDGVLTVSVVDDKIILN